MELKPEEIEKIEATAINIKEAIKATEQAILQKQQPNEQMVEIDFLLDQLNFNYNYAMRLKNSIDEHRWSRRQTQYDSEKIASISQDLINIANALFELREKCKGLSLNPQPLDEGELDKEIEKFIDELLADEALIVINSDQSRLKELEHFSSQQVSANYSLREKAKTELSNFFRRYAQGKDKAVEEKLEKEIETLQAEKAQKQLCIDDLKRQLVGEQKAVEEAVKKERDRILLKIKKLGYEGAFTVADWEALKKGE